jgi:polyisoprenoid-binding protein YceI
MFTRHAWIAALLGLGALLSHFRAGATEFTLDPRRTVVAFEMRSMGTLQRGEFRHTAGTVTLDSAAERGELAIVIDARSLRASSAATTNFVRGPSMLNTAAHPEIAYRAQHIVFLDGKPARIEGELTLLGVTRSVPLQVSSYDCDDESVGGERCAIVATASVKRSAFGMTRYMLFASDDVKLAIQAEGVTR